jgi:hypothetical protein
MPSHVANADQKQGDKVIGSVMSTMVFQRDRIRFKVREPSSEGFKLFQYSFSALVTLTDHERYDLFSVLMNLFLPLEKGLAPDKSRG